MYSDLRSEFGVHGAIAGALICMIAGYQESGCWEGAAIGAIAGAIVGAATQEGYYFATGGAAVNALVSKILASEFIEGNCGCNKQGWNTRRAILVSTMSCLGGGVGYGIGGTTGIELSPGWALNGEANLGPILGGFIEGGFREFGGEMGGNMGATQ